MRKKGSIIALTVLCMALVGCGSSQTNSNVSQNSDKTNAPVQLATQNVNQVATQNMTQAQTQAATQDERIEKLNLHTGDVISLGNYNGKGLRWKVIQTGTTTAMVMLEGAVTNRPYHETEMDVTWENSDIRRWLNDDFYNAAFSDKDKWRIIDTQLTNKPNPDFGISSGNNTVDKVFLLSIDEVLTLLKTDRARMFVHYYKGGTQKWWLRTSGSESNRAGDVSESGHVHEGGEKVTNKNAIIPVMWIRLY